MKKVVIVAVVLGLVVPAGLLVWARASLSSAAVRDDVASQLSRALGQPVTIGSIGPTLLPRPALTLGEVRIGNPVRVTIARLDVGAAIGALFSRRIEDASVRVSGAQVELPLPAFTLRSSPSSGGRVEIVSVEEIVLSDLAIVSGNRTLTGEVDVVPEDSGLTIRRIVLSGDDTSVEITGRLTNLTGPAGELAVSGDSLNVLDLAAVASAFSLDSAPEAPAAPTGDGDAQETPRSTTERASSAALTITLDAQRALVGPLALEPLTGGARLTHEGVSLDQLAFGIFEGRGGGSATVSLGEASTYQLQASIDDVNVAQVAVLAGKPDTMTGRLQGTLDVEGRVSAPLQTAIGTARVEATDGTVRGLGFVQTLSVLTAGRQGATPGAAPGSPPGSDAYSRVGLSLDIAGGIAQTDDFRFESSDVILTAAGTIALDGSAVNLTGQAALSNGMSAPATVTGTVTDPRVHVDMGAVAGPALSGLQDMDPEDALKTLFGGLGGLLGR